MKRYTLIIIFSILSILKFYSQIVFEPGYFIDNQNQRTDCLIKNVDWRSTPVRFEYKLTHDSDVYRADIQAVKEFGIIDELRYIRALVLIDRSDDNTNYLSYERDAVFNEELLFLKVIIEGNASLYQYSDGNLIRFFYNTGNGIQQLVHKYYSRQGSFMMQENNQFKQQLLKELPCPQIEQKTVERLSYTEKDLSVFFATYNDCKNSTYVTYNKPKQKTKWFNLSVRPGINFSSFESVSDSRDYWNVDFGNKINVRLGLEAEFFLPFHKNKWSVIIEPTYRYYEAEYVQNLYFLDYVSEVSYKSIEVPVGLRHRFFLSDKSAFFINASFIVDIPVKNSFVKQPLVKYLGDMENEKRHLEISARYVNLAFGVGYKYNDKVSIEARYHTSRDVVVNYVLERGIYNNIFSIVLGYSLF